MLYAAKRLALGVSLIALTSAILLLSDRSHRAGAAHTVLRLAIVQHANTTVLEDGIRGTIDALSSRGYRDGERISIDRFNAQGDMPTGIAIARQVIAGNYDLVITSSTPSMQAMANSNRDGLVRHVFTLVADPFVSGVGLDRANPLQHAPYMIGQGVFPPVEKAFQAARLMRPELQRIGVAWNPAESNSLAFVTKGRELAAAMGLTLLEANAESTAGVGDAINSLLGRGAEAIWIGGDNTVIAAVDSVIAIGKRMGVPVFTVLPGTPDRGTLFDAGPNFYEVGRQGGLLAADALEGADFATVPIRDVLDLVPAYLSVNTTVLKGLKQAWRVPDTLLTQATVVVDDTGVHRKDAPVPATTVELKAAPLAKKWRVSLVHLNRVLDVQEAEQGVLDGLREAGLVEGRDFDESIRDAQGDMATVSSQMDAALGDRADMIISFSTPALQAALQRVKQIPIVFTYVSDAIAAGAGTSVTSHVPNVTGVYLVGDYAQMPPLLRAYLPRVRVVGTVYTPAEVNMVTQLGLMKQAMSDARIEVKVVAANSASEVGDATLALLANHVDAIVQIPGNLTVAAFPNMAQVAKRARVPMFVFQGSQVRSGAVAGLVRDYYDSGRAAATLAARVMRGESPASIPFVGFSKTKLLVNLTAARDARLTTPADLVAKADEVVGK